MILISLLISCNYIKKENKVISKKFFEKIEDFKVNNKNDIININELIDFDFDVIYTNPPYTLMEYIKDFYGLKKLPVKKNIEYYEDRSLLLFVKDNCVIEYIEVPLNQGIHFTFDKIFKENARLKLENGENWILIKKFE